MAKNLWKFSKNIPKVKTIPKAIDIAAKIIYPHKCMGCNCLLNIKAKVRLCEACKKEFNVYKGFKCEKCGKAIEHKGRCLICNTEKRYFDKGYCVLNYSGAVRNAILKFKYKNKFIYAKYFGKTLTDYAKDNIHTQYDYVTAVPLHKTRQKARGYNQAELIAKIVAKNINSTYQNLLIRQKNTLPQNNLNKKQRYENIKGAFCLKENDKIKGKAILIIDDIYTTGATVNECCKVLRREKPLQIDFLALSSKADAY